MKKLPRIFVGSESDTRTVRRAISGLRALARLGRLAEKALLEIETRGEVEGRVAWLSFHQQKKRRLGAAHLMVSKIVPFAATKRSDAPDISGLKPEIGKIATDTHSGKKTSDVLVKLPVLVEHEKKFVWDRSRRTIGTLRYTRDGGSFHPVYSEGDVQWRSYVIRLRKTGQAEKDKAALAHCLALHMVGELNPKDPRVAEMLRSLRSWLVSDGVVQRFFDDLLGAAVRHAVVNDVMTR